MIGWCGNCEKVCEGEPVAYKRRRVRNGARKVLVIDGEGQAHEILENVLEDRFKPIKTEAEDADADQ